MKRENIQLQTAVRLLLEYLLEQKETLKAAIAVQHADASDDKSGHTSRTEDYSLLPSNSSDSSAVPGSSNTIN